MADLSKLLPILDMLAKSGDLTTEWKSAKASGRMALILLILGLLGLVAGCVGDAFGAGSKIGIIAGGLTAFLGVITQVASQLGYTANRTAVKAQAKDLAVMIVKAPAAEIAAAPAPIIVGPPAPAPVVFGPPSSVA